MKSYCSLPFIRLKIDADGNFHSCCHQDDYYGNFITDDITLEEAMKSTILKEVRVATLNKSLHKMCNNTKCPVYYTNLDRNQEVSITPYPKQIELALPPTWCNIGGLNPSPDTACIMCPRSSKWFMDRYKIDGEYFDYTDKLLEIIKPAIPHLNTFTILGIAEPFYKGRLFDALDKVEFKKYKDNILFWTYCNGSLFGNKYQDLFLNEYTSKSCIGFSIDAATPETYKKIRRLDYYPTIQKNLENYFKKVNSFKETRDWSFTAYNINELNLHEMEDMLRFGNNIGVHKVQFTLTYIPAEGIALPLELLCNKDNWQKFWEKQQRVEQLAKELNQQVEFYVPFHGGFLEK